MPGDPGGKAVQKREYRGFPKKLPCLVCGKDRVAKWPGDRIHAACREARAQAVAAEYTLIARRALREHDE